MLSLLEAWLSCDRLPSEETIFIKLFQREETTQFLKLPSLAIEYF